MSKAKITARFYGPRLMRRARRLPVEAQHLLDQALDRTAQNAEKVFEHHAPEDTSRLKRGIVAVPSRTGYVIRVTAKDPETGFDYVAVTRFGHRVKRIYPVKGRTSSGRRVRRQGVLRVALPDGVIYRQSVRGVRVKSDWVRPARVEAHQHSREEMRRVGIEIARRWGE